MRHQIICGDCLEVLKELNDDSIDLMATDPPYNLSFMGMNWDKTLPSIEIWKQCIRVLKPGAFAFVMSIPRQDCLSRMIINLEDAGFETDFTPIYWAYASGFPKAGNISKMVDKRLGVEREIVGRRIHPTLRNIPKVKSKAYHVETLDSYQTAESWDITASSSTEAKSLDGAYAGFQPKPAVEVIIVTMKPLSEKGYMDQAMKNKKGITWLDNCKIPYKSDTDKESARFGTQTDIKGNAYGTNRPSEGHVLARNVLSSEQGRFPANLLVSDDVLNDGKERESVEHKINNTNPQEKSLYKGGFNPITTSPTYSDSGSFSRYFDLDAWWKERYKKLPENVQKTFPFLIVPKASKSEPRGRFPANLLVSDDILNDGKEWKSGGSVTGNEPSLPTTNIYGEYKQRLPWQSYSDSGSFSRYFDLDIWWQERVKKLPKEVQKTFPFLIVPKASKSEKDKGLEYLSTKDIPYSDYRENYDTTKSYVSEYPDGKKRPMNKMKNDHPTVKPLTLMSYLITLGSRKNDVVLDPFVGSGTVSLASKMLSRKSIGIETNPEYVKIAKARLKSISSLDEWL